MSDRNYLFFALQIDYPDKLNLQFESNSFWARWELSISDFYKALGGLKNKGVMVAIAN